MLNGILVNGQCKSMVYYLVIYSGNKSMVNLRYGFSEAVDIFLNFFEAQNKSNIKILIPAQN